MVRPWETPEQLQQILDEDMATCGNKPDETNRVSRTGTFVAARLDVLPDELSGLLWGRL